MIIGLGIDLARVDRIARLVDRYGERFLRRVFTEGERAAAGGGPERARRLAARFAAKEAALKALGTGLSQGIRWRDVEVVRRPGAPPALALHGAAARIARRRGIERLHVTLSHEGPFALAVVVAEAAAGPGEAGGPGSRRPEEGPAP